MSIPFGRVSLLVLLLSAVAVAESPNVVVFLVDDQGWAGTSLQLHPEVPSSRSAWFPTPELERMAAEGVRFSQAYSSAPRCSPSRAALQTGCCPARLRFTENGLGRRQLEYSTAVRGAVQIDDEHDSLPQGFPTLGNWLKDKAPDYVTAHFGKWHIGHHDWQTPSACGYDESDGATDNLDGLPTNTKTKTKNFGDDDPKQTFSLTSKAIDFMKRKKAAGIRFICRFRCMLCMDPRTHWPQPSNVPFLIRPIRRSSRRTTRP
jgi:arylsulfatase A-like enzyme